MRLKGNKILITGATSGIGEALMNKFLGLDNQVIAVGRDRLKLKLQELALKDRRFIPFACDISREKEIDNLVLFVEEEHPDTNILINNAGIQYNYHFGEEPQSSRKIEEEVSVNFLAPLKLTARLLPVLGSHQNAAIVNISSGLGLVPKMQAPVYCATKAGIHIFSKSLRYQLDHPKVFEIIPPLVDTPMTEGRGKGKIAPDVLVDEFIKAFQKDRLEINVGKVKLLRLVNRLWPSLAEKIMNKATKQ